MKRLPLLLVLFCSALPLLAQSKGDHPVRHEGIYNHFHAGIDQAAIQVNQHPSDPTAIHALADAVGKFSEFHLPKYVELPLQAQLESAERDYRSGKTRGISEDDVIALHNDIITKVGGPAYGLIDRHQFDTARLYLATYEPNFMGKGTPNGSEITRQLSPLQAVHVFGFVMAQKINTPAWQVPPGADWKRTTVGSQSENQPDSALMNALQHNSIGVSDTAAFLLRAHNLLKGGK